MEISKMNGWELKSIVWQLKLTIAGQDYEKAKKLCQPYIDEINRRGKIIAKKHNKKFVPLTFLTAGRR